jgi:NAD(P)-dependent dehydrogenase (short-subunit alcohol dehydrogenase family)
VANPVSYMPNFRADGKTALVTGAGRGIGRHIALTLAESGAQVAIVARSANELAEVELAAAAVGANATPFAVDITDMASLRGLVANIERELGPIDFLVNNAGTNVPELAVDITEDHWDTIVDLNLRSTFFLSQIVGKSMIATGRPGRVVNVTSQLGEVGLPGRAAYAASKAAVVRMSQVLALEWAEFGIRVNCVGPTFVSTALGKAMLADPDFASEVLRRLPIGRLGLESEVAAAVLYLVSDSADIVTGHHLLLDGGWTAQ